MIFEHSLRLFRKKRSLRAANAAEMFFCSAERAFAALSAYFIYKVSGAAYFSAFRRLLPLVLLGAVKNIKLIRLAEFDEVGNIACYTNK